MNKYLNLMYRFSYKAMWIIALLSSMCVLILNFIFTADISQNYGETVTITSSVLHSILSVIIAVFLLVALWLLKDKLCKIKIKEAYLFAFFTLLYIIAAIYLISNTNEKIRADAYQTYRAALDYNLLDKYTAFEPGGYIYTYPNQLGLLTFDRLITSIWSSPKALFAANLICVIITNYLIYKISNLLFNNHRINIITIIFTFAFVPHLLYILFAYGLIPGLTAITAAFYFALRFNKTKKWYQLILTLLFSSMAIILKNNYLIGVVAIALYFMLNWFKTKSYKKLLAALLAIICLFLPLKLLTLMYEKDTGLKLDQGSPTILWIAMGTDLDHTVRAPGWYNSYNLDTYNASTNAEEAAEKGMEKFKDNLNKMKSDPKKTVKFFGNKTISQWCEPMLQSDWSGPLPDCDQELNTRLMLNFYSGGLSNKVVTSVMKFITLCLWGLSVIFLLFYAHKTKGWEISFMFFVGGLIFHTVWEGKSQYIMPYVILLIPFAAFTLYKLCKINYKETKLFLKLFKKQKKSA